MEAKLVYITASNHNQAIQLAESLLKKSLVACVNIIDNVTSLYQWQGQFCQEKESILIAKTTDHRLAELQEFVQEHHPYENPCLVSCSIQGLPDFLNWVKDETS